MGFVSVHAQQDPNDPGNVDVVLINNDGLDNAWDVGLGESSPVGVTLMWDQTIVGLEFNLEVSSVDGGLVHLDSAVFTDLLSFGTVLPDRSVEVFSDGTLPDTIRISAHGDAPDEYLYPSGVAVRTLMYIYMSGVAEGEVTMINLDGGGGLQNQSKIWADGQSVWHAPVVTCEPIIVREGGGISFNDPGERDELHLEGLVLRTGLSIPINVRIKNDQPLRYLTFMFEVSTADSGLVQFDSVQWVGRLKDRSVCDARIVDWMLEQTESQAGWLRISAHTIHLDPDHYPLPVGDEVCLQIYLTALDPGTIVIDTVTYPGSVYNRHNKTTYETMDGDMYCPEFSPLLITATDDQPPVFTRPAGYLSPAVAGQTVQFEVESESDPIGHNVDITLRSMTGWDDGERLPESPPNYDTETQVFTWGTGLNDVGIWRASFLAVDTETGAADTADIEIEVLSGPELQVAFDLVTSWEEGIANVFVADMVHGNFDQDPDQEVVFAPYIDVEWLRTIHVYEYTPPSTFELTADGVFNDFYFNLGMQPGFFDDDDNLDLVMMGGNQLYLLLGNGDNTFTARANPPYLPLGGGVEGKLTNFNADAYLDYIMTDGKDVQVFAGTGGIDFAEGTTVSIGLSLDSESLIHNMNSADFNGDGWDDLAISSTEGLSIVLNNQAGGYSHAYTYPLEFTSVDISITNEGADFNGDGYYDLCISLPLADYRWYADATSILVYLGNGDGSFMEPTAITSHGLSLVNQTGDFNKDGHLDIGFANHTYSYLGILFGDSEGSFSNQLRFHLPTAANPNLLDVMDIDVDGDLDVVMSAYNMNAPPVGAYYRYLFVNQHDPQQVTSDGLRVVVEDNAGLELVDPRGAQLSAITSGIVSGDYYRLDLNDNDMMDASVTVGAPEPGRYDLVVTPQRNLDPEATFSLEYQIEGGLTREIARDLPITPEGYTFPLFPGCTSPVAPAQGAIVRTNLISFVWEEFWAFTIERQGSMPLPDQRFEFQCAHDPTFNDLVGETVVDGYQYELPEIAQLEELTSFYWRVRPEGDATWDHLFVFHAQPADGPKDPVDTDEDDDVGGDETDDLDDSEGDAGTEIAIEVGSGRPLNYGLAQNAPNPFNPTTEILVALPTAAYVKLDVFNIMGQKVATLVDEHREAGYHIVAWDASSVASGIYLYRLSAGDFVATKKMVVMK
jgi:hypothetical protein